MRLLVPIISVGLWVLSIGSTLSVAEDLSRAHAQLRRQRPALPPKVIPLAETGPGTLGTSPLVLPLKPVAAKPDEIPANHKLLYEAARDRAAKQVARDKGISRKEARELIDQVSDASLHAAVTAANIQVKPLPVGGPIQNLLDWFAAHQEQIAAIVKLILTLLALLGQPPP